MDLDIYSGTTILMPHQMNGIKHLWVVLTDPEGSPESILAVNITSRGINISSEYEWDDPTVILDREEHPFITHESLLYYGKAKIIEVNKLQRLIQTGTASFEKDCSDTMLRRCQGGIFDSPFVTNEIKEYCRQKWRNS